MVSATIVRVIPQMPRKAQPSNPPHHNYQQRSKGVVPLEVVGSLVWNEKLGQRLENLRIGKGFTQIEIYNELIRQNYNKITVTTISKLEKGVMRAGDSKETFKFAKTEHLHPILEILGYSVEEFYSENADALK